MNGVEYLNTAVLHALDAYRDGGRKSGRIVFDLLALAELCRSGDAWRTVQVNAADLDELSKLALDQATKTTELLKPGGGFVFLLPRPVSIGEGEIEHVAVAHVPAGQLGSGIRPMLAFRQNILVYAAATKTECLCGYANPETYPTVGSIRGFTWSDQGENWREELDSDQIRRDARVLALAMALLALFQGRLPKV